MRRPTSAVRTAAVAALLAAIALEVLYQVSGITALDYVAVADLLVTTGFTLWYVGAHIHLSSKPRGTMEFPDVKAFRGYSGIGIVFAVLLASPVLVAALPLYVLALEAARSVALALLAGVAIPAAAFLLVSYFFVPMRIQVLQSGILFSWPVLGRATFVGNSDLRLHHLAGPVFYGGAPWTIPASWFMVRGHVEFCSLRERTTGENPN